MQISWGRHEADLEIPADRLVTLARSAPVPPVTDLAAAARGAMECPYEFPPLQRALTPEDHVVVVIEPGVPQIGILLAEILKQLVEARVDPASVTLVCPNADQDQSWIDDLPDEFQEVNIETHLPGDRKRLAYLATTQAGRRIYLNRSLVDADQVVVLTHRRYDTRLGFAGGAGVLFPGLSDDETAGELRHLVSRADPNKGAWKLRHEAEEVAFLLGVPFFVQVIEGPDGDILHVVGGSHESCQFAEQLFDAAWHGTLDEPADLVIATVPGEGHTFTDLARAALSASRIVRLGGRIVILSDADPELGEGAQILRREEDPASARSQILEEKPDDLEASSLWATAAAHAKLYLLSRLPLEVAEELYATPLDRPDQCRKLINAAARVVILPHAHRTLATLRE